MTSVKEMDVDVSTILALGKFFYHKLGLWFETYANVGRMKRVLRFVMTFNISVFIAMSIANILDRREKALAESAFEVLFLVRQISVLQKIYVFRSRVSEISELFSNAFEKISVPDLVNDIFHKYQSKCKRKPKLITTVAVMTFFNALIWLISILALAHFGESDLTASSVLAGATAVPIWLPFDINKYPLVQKIFLAYQMIGLVPIMATFMGFFAFYSGALILAQEMYTHLNDVLILLQKPINQDPPFDYELNIRQNKEVKDVIKYTVQHHIRSLKYFIDCIVDYDNYIFVSSYIDGLNTIFSTVMLLEIWGILGIQCLLAFQFASVRAKLKFIA